MDIEQVVAEMPKAANPHQEFRDALRRITPLTELIDVSDLRLKSLTTMQEALDSSNTACACARWGAFNEGSEARARLLAGQGYRKVLNEEAMTAKILSLIGEYNSLSPEGQTDTDVAAMSWLGWQLQRWLLEGE